MKRNNYFIVNVMVIIGVIVCILFSIKIYKTAFQLYFINDSIQFYEEQPIKTDEMTKDVEKDFEERENNFYHSTDPIIRWFSNLNGLLKLAVLVADAIFVVYAVKESLIFTVNNICRQNRRRHKRYYRR